MTTTTINTAKVNETIAKEVVACTVALQEAKANLEQAKDKFKALGIDSHTTDNGAKISVVTANPRKLDSDKLQELLSDQKWYTVSKRTAQLSMLDNEISAKRISLEQVSDAITVGETISVRVTVPTTK